MTNLTLKIDPIELNEEQFFQLCSNNRDLKFERNSSGDLIIMSPTGGKTSNRNVKIIAQLYFWNEQYKLGEVFESSVGFKLPNGANRAPDAAWIPLSKWNSLTPQQQEKFLPLSPDFVIELKSPSDTLKSLQEKMIEYLENGTRLGWLINPQNQQVEIYRQGQKVEILDSPNTLSGEDILPNFLLNLESIW